jgi:hypothetical protein
MSDFTDSAPYKRLQSILDMKDDGSKELSKAKEAAQRRLGELSTSYMAKHMGVEDPFKMGKMERTTNPETGKTKMSPALLPEELRNVRSGGGGGGAGIPKVGPKKPLDMKKGGVVSSASKRADGCAVKGKTKGRMV